METPELTRTLVFRLPMTEKHNAVRQNDTYMQGYRKLNKLKVTSFDDFGNYYCQDTSGSITTTVCIQARQFSMDQRIYSLLANWRIFNRVEQIEGNNVYFLVYSDNVSYHVVLEVYFHVHESFFEICKMLYPIYIRDLLSLNEPQLYYKELSRFESTQKCEQIICNFNNYINFELPLSTKYSIDCWTREITESNTTPTKKNMLNWNYCLFDLSYYNRKLVLQNLKNALIICNISTLRTLPPNVLRVGSKNCLNVAMNSEVVATTPRLFKLLSQQGNIEKRRFERVLLWQADEMTTEELRDAAEIAINMKICHRILVSSLVLWNYPSTMAIWKKYIFSSDTVPTYIYYAIMKHISFVDENVYEKYENFLTSIPYAPKNGFYYENVSNWEVKFVDNLCVEKTQNFDALKRMFKTDNVVTCNNLLKEWECVCCLNTAEESQEICILPCNHSICAQCQVAWAGTSSSFTCTLCRAKISTFDRFYVDCNSYDAVIKKYITDGYVPIVCKNSTNKLLKKKYRTIYNLQQYDTVLDKYWHKPLKIVFILSPKSITNGRLNHETLFRLLRIITDEKVKCYEFPFINENLIFHNTKLIWNINYFCK